MLQYKESSRSVIELTQFSLKEINIMTKIIPTSDALIRVALKQKLEKHYIKDNVRIIEEMGIGHGVARIDIAVVNGIMHGYEIKSDRDTLQRLSEQMGAYDSVFDQVTLVVGKKHLYDSINIVPDWWGIMTARVGDNKSIAFNNIRGAENNPKQNSASIAKLLWREEALMMLEEVGEADGLRSKPRISIYEKLSTTFDQDTLGKKVRDVLFFRKGWRPDAPLILNGG